MSRRTNPADQAARTRIRSDLDRSYIVEAAAGTGKTTELIGRIIAVLATAHAGATIDSIAAVTFTEKAAGELKLRLREELEHARQRCAGSERQRIEAALAYLEEARVSTIHGFCADLLRERPIEAAIDPQFQVLTDDQAARLYDVAFDGWLQDQLREPGEGVRRSLRRTSRRNFGAEVDEDGPVERLRRAGLALIEWRDHPTRWRRDPFDRAGEIGRLVAELDAFASLSDGPAWDKDPLYLDTTRARMAARAIRNGLVPRDDLDGLEALLIDLHHDRGFARPRKGGSAAYSRRYPRAMVWDRRQVLYEAIGEFERRANADLAAALQSDLQGSVERHAALKAAEGALDFVDLLLQTRTLLHENSEVRSTFRRRLTHIFVDEFQDTDPLQAEILILLSGDPDAGATAGGTWRDVTPRPGCLFIVGDPKQSIYRFRRADVGAYRDVCDWLERKGAARVELTASFRSTPPLQRIVNAAFAPLMTDDPATHLPGYVPLTPWRDDHPDQPAVVVLPVPAPYGARGITKAAIEKSLPDAVGAFVEWLVRRSGWTVPERQRDRSIERVAIQPGHICLLFRRFTSFNEDVTAPYVQALEARDIPHLLVGGKAFHDREEVGTLRAALAAIEWPDDELAVFATLRGALIALGDDVLLEYRHHFRRFHPYQIPQHLADRLQPVGEALAMLRTLHQQRNSRPVADTLTDLLASTRAHVGFALRPGGEQVLANVLHLADLARRYEAGGGLSFRGFVASLGDAASRGEAAEAPVLEEGSNGVRLMTVHKAKGLEFPVVLLVDPTCKLSRDTADRHLEPSRGLCAMRLSGWAPSELLEHEPLEVERDRNEGHRVAYVAATRARDLLVVPAVGDEPLADGWLSSLNDAIYPPVERRRQADAAPPSVPPFKRDSVLERPGGDPARADTVHPGLHRFGTTTAEPYHVVWWDPGVLELGIRPPGGVRHETLIGKDASRDVVEQTLARFRSWETGRAEAVSSGARPSLMVRTASEWAADEQLMGGSLPEVAIEDLTSRDGSTRPSGTGFGTLVHAVLASVDLNAADADVALAAGAHARLLGASSGDGDAAAAVVSRVLASPLLRRAAKSPRCRREVPVTMAERDGGIIEGVVDLVFDEDGRSIVVDFKTDVEIGRLGLDRYSRQVAWYAAAIARATGRAAEAILLRV